MIFSNSTSCHNHELTLQVGCDYDCDYLPPILDPTWRKPDPASPDPPYSFANYQRVIHRPLTKNPSTAPVCFAGDVPRVGEHLCGKG